MTTDQLREDLIGECGRRMLAGHAAGDMQAARFWLAVQTGQINQRSPAMVARMEACFFADEGERVRVSLGFHMARVAPEKTDSSARPAAVPCSGVFGESLMDIEQIAVIEELRLAAANHPVVAELLDVIEKTIMTGGDTRISANDEQLEYLETAIKAAAFVKYDRAG